MKKTLSILVISIILFGCSTKPNADVDNNQDNLLDSNKESSLLVITDEDAENINEILWNLDDEVEGEFYIIDSQKKSNEYVDNTFIQFEIIIFEKDTNSEIKITLTEDYKVRKTSMKIEDNAETFIAQYDKLMEINNTLFPTLDIYNQDNPIYVDFSILISYSLDKIPVDTYLGEYKNWSYSFINFNADLVDMDVVKEEKPNN